MLPSSPSLRGVGQEGQSQAREDKGGTGRADTRKHAGDVHCILDIVDVGCDTRDELAPKYIPEPKSLASRMANAWRGTAGQALWVCLCFPGQSESGLLGRAKAAAKGPRPGEKTIKTTPRPPKRFPRVLTSRPWGNQKWDQIVSDTAGAVRDKDKQAQAHASVGLDLLLPIIVDHHCAGCGTQGSRHGGI